jgi:predicted CopG family antitoxin
MPRYEKSNIVRTTIDIDDLVLRDLKRLKEKLGKSLGQLISELLAQAIHQLRLDLVRNWFTDRIASAHAEIREVASWYSPRVNRDSLGRLDDTVGDRTQPRDGVHNFRSSSMYLGTIQRVRANAASDQNKGGKSIL